MAAIRRGAEGAYQAVEQPDPFFAAIHNETPLDLNKHNERWQKLLLNHTHMTRRYTIQHPNGSVNFWTPVTPASRVIPHFLERCESIGQMPKDDTGLTVLNATVTSFPSPFTNNPEVTEVLQAPGILVAWDRNGNPVLATDVNIKARGEKDDWIDAKKSVPHVGARHVVQLADNSVTVAHVADATINGLRWEDDKGMTLTGTQEVVLWQPFPQPRA